MSSNRPEPIAGGVMVVPRVAAAISVFRTLAAGLIVGGEGLHTSSQGKRVRFSGTDRIIIDGPFAETKELLAGFWLWKVASMDEAIEWVKRMPQGANPEPFEVEIRRAFEAEEFCQSPTP